jgi:hypothetical protein
VPVLNPGSTDETTGKWKGALKKRSKAELIEFIVEIARADLFARQKLQSRFNLDVSNKELIADTRNAINAATDSFRPSWFRLP